MKLRRSLILLSAIILLLLQREVRAQSIPLMIPYSGTVSVGGTPFNGSGQFKFAIVNKNCTLNPVGATCATLWSNDNTSAVGSEPTAAVTIPVTNGVFTVKLGDTTLTNMPTAIPTTAFSASETFLRIWFNDGATGSQQLTPDRQLVSVPYAYHSETAGSITGAGVVGTSQIANGAVTSALIAGGAVGTTQLGTGAVATADLADGAVTSLKMNTAFMKFGRILACSGCFCLLGSTCWNPNGSITSFTLSDSITSTSIVLITVDMGAASPVVCVANQFFPASGAPFFLPNRYLITCTAAPPSTAILNYIVINP